MPVKRFNVIDLFAGVGGLSLGFEMVGAKVLMANEYDESIATSYVKNRPNNNMIIEDIVSQLEDEMIIPVAVGVGAGSRENFLYDKLDLLLVAILDAGYDIVSVSELLKE